MSFNINGVSTKDKIDLTIGDKDIAIRVLCEKDINGDTNITVYRKYGINGDVSKNPIARFNKFTKDIVRNLKSSLKIK